MAASFTDSFRSPGVYFDTAARAAPSGLAIADTRVAGFVGLTQRGPVGVPIKVSSFDEFGALFGSRDDAYTAQAVHSYFRQGGSACYVVRTAHRAAAGAPTDESLEPCAAAQHTLLDALGKPTLHIAAGSEGTWGNNVWIRVERQTTVSALLTRDLELGVGAASVAQTRGFEVGQLVRIHDREHQDFIVVTAVGDREIRWSAQTPLARGYRASAPTQLEVHEFELEVILRDERELFRHLQMSPLSRHYAPKVIAARSRYIAVSDAHSGSSVPHQWPVPVPPQRLDGGRNGDVVTPEDFIGWDHGPADSAGLLALGRHAEVALLAAPDAARLYEQEPGPLGEIKLGQVQEQMVRLCEHTSDRFAILDLPRTKDVEQVRRLRRRLDSSYAAYYFPWLKYDGEALASTWVPPSAIMAGVFAGAEARVGVHQAPANVELAGVSDMSVYLSEDHLTQLGAEGINTFRSQRGIRPWGSRTASSDPAWVHITSRRLFIMLRRALDQGFSWVPFEPNKPTTWQVIRLQAENFLESLWQKGMLVGASPSQAFFVQCDGETNAADVVAGGRLVCEIGVAPVAPAEFMMVSLVQEMAT